MIIYIIVVISKHAEKEETERRIKKDFRRMHVGHIHKTYPNAFSTYWGKPDLANSVFKDYSNVILNENSVNWTDYQWRILEDKRQNEIQKKLWLISQIEEIRKSYPNGFREFKKRNPTSTDEDVVPTVENIVNNRVQIELLEKEYCNSQKENRLTAKVFAADEITEQMESYVIISIEPFVSVGVR